MDSFYQGAELQVHPAQVGYASKKELVAAASYYQGKNPNLSAPRVLGHGALRGRATYEDFSRMLNDPSHAEAQQFCLWAYFEKVHNVMFTPTSNQGHPHARRRFALYAGLFFIPAIEAFVAKVPTDSKDNCRRYW